MTSTTNALYAARVRDFGPAATSSTFNERRAEVSRLLADRGEALVLYGGTTARRSASSEFPFRPDSNFHYLTGLEEPGAVLVINPAKAGREFTLFVRPRNRKAETWSGRRIGPEGAKKQIGADEAYPLSALKHQLPRLLDGARHVYMPIGVYPKLQRRVFEACELLHRRNRDGQVPPLGFLDVRALMAPLRVRKDAAALASLRHAVELSAQAHRAAMATVEAGMHEYELQAMIESHFRRYGSSGPGYGSIIASGDNATILHYVENRDALRGGQLVLIDAGCEWDYHTGDITRTFPVDGKFTGPQRDMYEVVLAANQAGIEEVRPGSSIAEVHQRCVAILSQGMRDLGLLDASIDQIVSEKLYEKYYMHRTSHWLGLDVHDVGAYTQGPDAPVRFAANMVLTVEPGLYVPNDPEEPANMRGVGIRIEDDVLVTETGHEVLSASAPKSVEDIEAWMEVGTE